MYTNAGLLGEEKMMECFLEPIKQSAVTVKETDNGLRTLSDRANYDKPQKSNRFIPRLVGSKGPVLPIWLNGGSSKAWLQGRENIKPYKIMPLRDARAPMH